MFKVGYVKPNLIKVHRFICLGFIKLLFIGLWKVILLLKKVVVQWLKTWNFTMAVKSSSLHALATYENGLSYLSSLLK
jgi:hypothetical protein